MKLNLLEKLIMKLFAKTFDKAYKQGLTDCFNFLSGPTSGQDRSFMRVKSK